MSDIISRREWMRQLSSIGASVGVASALGVGISTSARARRSGGARQNDPYTTYFGDLHLHNNIGYAQGSLERTFDIGREHLDFMAFTPHAYWHDMEEYTHNIEQMWINGFAVTQERWPEVVSMNREYHEPGEFVTIPGYEWHSSHMGDYHVLFPDLDAELFLPETLEELQEFVKKRGCIMVPHHIANRQGRRGANFARRDPDVSPIVEMYSEWGNAEWDRGHYPYLRHSPGGRWTKNTIQYRLAQGDRFGIVGSTDDHAGTPGAYHQGLAAVLADDLSRESIFDALWNRRTYAVTGDRIDLRFSVNGKVMGQEMPYVRDREISVDVTGWDQINRVEILKNNRVIHRDFPMDREPTSASWDEPVLVRFEYGWGPWAALPVSRTADWDVEFTVRGGMIEDIHPCFIADPPDESRRDKIVEQTAKRARLNSFTARRKGFEDHTQKAVILKMRGNPDSMLSINLNGPTDRDWSLSFGQLAETNEVLYVDRYPWESALVHRLVFNDRFQTSFTITDRDDGQEANWYYARVIQANEQMAWSSPIWVDAA